MFKAGNFEAEIAKAMADNLSHSLLKKQASDQKKARTLKIVQAVEHLNAAANSLESLGLIAEAEAIITLLQKMADSKSHESSKEKPEAFEINTLLHEPKDSKDDLGEQIIEMRSIAASMLKKKV